jgi:hypothetical protein
MGQVYASDWNPLQNTIANVMGAPNGLSYGWNKASSIQSAQVNSSVQINSTHYNKLKNDIDFCYTHIIGSASSLPTKSTGDRVYQVDLSNISAAVTYINTYKTVAAGGQLTQTNVFSNTLNFTWTATLGATYTIPFGSITNFNAFWNGGGSVFFNMSRYAGSATSQNQGWTNTLANMGFIYITPTTSGQTANAWAGTTYVTGGISNFSPFPTTLFRIYDQDTNYTGNYLDVKVYLDGPAGAASSLSFVILLVDAHLGTAGGPDTIDGNIALTITQKYPYTFAASEASSSAGVLS